MLKRTFIKTLLVTSLGGLLSRTEAKERTLSNIDTFINVSLMNKNKWYTVSVIYESKNIKYFVDGNELIRRKFDYYTNQDLIGLSGVTNYLNLPLDPFNNFGNKDFTVEFWSPSLKNKV